MAQPYRWMVTALRFGGFVEASWGPLGSLLGVSRGLSGAFWGPLGASLDFSGPRARNVRSGPPSGPALGAVLGASWAILEASGAVLGPSGAVLGPSWRPVGLC